MNRIAAFSAALALVLTANVAVAGGPVKIEDDEDVVAVLPAKAGSLGAGGGVVIGLVALALIAAASSKSGSHGN